MRTVGFFIICSLLLVTLVACSSQEDQADQQFSQAQQAQHEGKLDTAQQLYRQILADFPATQVAQQVRSELPALERQIAERDLHLQETAKQALNSILRVLEGYRSMYHRLPASVADIDNGEFFFDSGYMAESVPENFEVFLALAKTGDSYRVWSFPRGGMVGVLYESRRATYQPARRTAGEIPAGLRAGLVKGRLTFLSEKG